jgi:hypothetical protein
LCHFTTTITEGEAQQEHAYLVLQPCFFPLAHKNQFTELQHTLYILTPHTQSQSMMKRIIGHGIISS